MQSVLAMSDREVARDIGKWAVGLPSEDVERLVAHGLAPIPINAHQDFGLKVVDWMGRPVPLPIAWYGARFPHEIRPRLIFVDTSDRLELALRGGAGSSASDRYIMLDVSRVFDDSKVILLPGGSEREYWKLGPDDWRMTQRQAA